MMANSSSSPKRASYLNRRWARLADSCELTAHCLEEEVPRCSRKPVRLSEYAVPDVIPPASLGDRLSRCTSYGQHLDALPGDRQSIGQFGLYGTAAAIELLTRTSGIKALPAKPSNELTPSEIHLGKLFLSSWNFLNLITSSFSEVEQSKFWEQSRITLRVCHVLRAAAAARPMLSALADQGKSAALDPGNLIDKDLGATFGEAAVDTLCRTLHARILSARIKGNGAFRIERPSLTTGFLFGCNSEDAPTTVTDWLFMWGSVISAVVRAAKSGAIDDEHLAAVCTRMDEENLEAVLRDKGCCSDDRYRLYALWALAQLDGPWQHRKKWLAAEIAETCSRLLKADMGLVDVHSPYQVFFNTRSAGEKYRDDYYVIPVMPIMVELLARYRPSRLFRPGVIRILRSWTDVAAARSKDGQLGRLPGQSGTYNGTVNALYYHEAALTAARAIRGKQKAGWLLYTWGALRENMTIVAGITFFLIAWADSLYASLHGTTKPQMIVSLTIALWSVFMFLIISRRDAKEVAKYFLTCVTSFMMGFLVRLVYSVLEQK